MDFGPAAGLGFAADLPWRGFDFFIRERLQQHVVIVYDSREKRKVKTRTLENRKGAAPGLERGRGGRVWCAPSADSCT